MKIARNAIFDYKKADVGHATNIPGLKVPQAAIQPLCQRPCLLN